MAAPDQLDVSLASTLIAAGVLLLIVLALGAACFLLYKRSHSDPGAAATAAPQAQPVAAGAGPGRLRGRERGQAGVRRRRAAAAAAAQEQEQQGSGSEGEEQDGQQPAARARNAQQPPEQAAPALRRKDAYEERRAAKDRQREAEEAAAEAEAARLEAEDAARQDAEAAQWMGLISTEGGGSGEAEAEQGRQGLLQSFVQYVQQRKTVELEELAAEFGLRVQDAIDRIKSLEQMGHLTGVMDDRGKYIYISMEEMAAVADYIQRRGRVAISELAAKSNTFISLESQDAPHTQVQSSELELDIFGEGPES